MPLTIRVSRLPMHSRPCLRRYFAHVPLLLAPVSAVLFVSGASARPLVNRPALSNPAPFGDSESGRELGEMPMGGPVVKANSAQIPTAGGPASDWTGGAPPAGTPAIPGVTYANASDTKSADPSQPPPALGPAPISIDSVRAIQVGSQRVNEAPMRVGNLDVLAPLVDEMPLLGATVTKADLNNVPGDVNSPIENQFFQINRPNQPPIVMSMGQNKAWIDRNEQTLRAAPLVVGNQIYLPIFSLAPLLGAAARLDTNGTLVLTPTVESVQVFPLRDTIAITVKTSKPIPGGLQFKSMTAPDGSSRLYVDFEGYSMGFDALNTTNERIVASGSGDVLRARAGMPSKFPGTTRVTLDLKKNLSGSVMSTPDPTIFAFVVAGKQAPPPPLVPDGRVGYPVPNDLKGMLIVLDAGHGGYDTGARGARTNEKDHTLDLIQRLASNLRARGADVQLTRSTDNFISLQGRVDFANTRKADLFISIHNNASDNKASNGTETFYYTAQSVGLAREIHRELSKATGLANRGVSSARFFVIRKTWMPSVLLEVAFVTNPREEGLLSSPDWCQRVVDGVTRGVSNYAKIYGKGSYN
ncbi:N-acetylmuramoyl-L-alanine amidase LytC [Abditibacteriota bacterium]|nr:N-acetylmuramoyl-L-alanine amidase LytC [Abditibacteriota bacterium]